MEAILQSIGDFLNNLSPLIVLPIVVMVLGLVLGQRPDRAFRSGLLTAVAFVGIFLTVGLLGEKISTIGQAFAQRTGTGLDVIDIGWPAASALAFATPVGNLIIPIGIALNIILLVLGLTQTLDVDIWNFWHAAFLGAIVNLATGSLALGLIAAAIAQVIAFFLADWSAPLISKYFKLPGVSIPHLQSAGCMLLAVPFALLINRIPFLKKLQLNPDRIRKRLGVLGEPIVLGLVIGVLLAWLAGESLTEVLTTGINIAAVMVLVPRMVGILMEGLTPVADAAREFMTKRFAGRKFHIGLDSAVLIGSPAVIASGLLMVPIELVLALLLASVGNRTLPFIDLADGVFVTAMLAPLVAGDVLLTVILGAIVMGVGLIFTTLLAPAITNMIATTAISVDIPTGFATYTVMSDAATPPTYALYYLFQTPEAVAIIVGLLVLVGLYFLKVKFPLGDKLFAQEEELDAR
ncbi:MAG TPA: PTS transporter subunit IIC [Anaerolineae bacterium]|nr:PTS transporter subunit IIC [Anaerolineae bacterium]HOQ98483.1 PTS transporter subunit IIC [Anaerolineae bacterium]HPL28119.1 PTS transporter subunit IIC [Anaerolineae bacterium]